MPLQDLASAIQIGYNLFGGGYKAQLDAQKAAADQAQRQNQLQADQVAGANDIAGQGLTQLGPQIFSDLQVPQVPPAAGASPPSPDLDWSNTDSPDAQAAMQQQMAQNSLQSAARAKAIMSQDPEKWFSSSLMQDPDKWAMVESSFPHVKNKSLIPGIWDEHMSQLFPDHARPFRMPSNMGGLMGGGGQVPEGEGQDGLGFTNRYVPKMGADGKMSYEVQQVTHKLSEAQKEMLRQDPVEGMANVPKAQQEEAAAFSAARRENLGTYKKAVNEVPAVASYITGSPEHPGGIRTAYQNAVSELGSNLSPDGKTLVGNLNPLQQKAMLMGLGQALNPSMGVREWELDLLAKNAPWIDRVKANLLNPSEGTTVPASVMQHAWNILSGRKGVAQENFHKAIAGYEPELAEHKLIPRDVIKNPDALKEYQAAYGVSVDASKGPDQAKAQVAKLPPGTLYHFTNPQTGEIVQRTRGAEQAPQEAPPAAAAPMGPFQQVSPPSKLQAMMSMKPGGAPVGQEPLPAGQLPSVQQMQRTGALPLGPLNNMQKTRASQADFARSQRINQLAAQIKNLDAQASAPVGAGAAGGQRQLLFAAQRAAMVKELMSLMPAALPAVSRFHLQQMP